MVPPLLKIICSKLIELDEKCEYLREASEKFDRFIVFASFSQCFPFSRSAMRLKYIIGNLIKRYYKRFKRLKVLDVDK